jgi:hypothetical protein
MLALGASQGEYSPAIDTKSGSTKEGKNPDYFGFLPVLPDLLFYECTTNNTLIFK